MRFSLMASSIAGRRTKPSESELAAASLLISGSSAKTALRTIIFVEPLTIFIIFPQPVDITNRIL
jgi:hypothetical protein